MPAAGRSDCIGGITVIGYVALMTTLARFARRWLAVGCALLGAAALGCAATPHRDGSSRSSARLDVSAPSILSYRPLSDASDAFFERFALGPQARPADRLLIRDGRGKQMAAYADGQWSRIRGSDAP